MRVEFYKHNLIKEDVREATKVLNSIFLTTGKVVTEFESKFSDYLDAKFTVGLTSCTAALHLGLLAYGIGKEDEVITTPLTFIATPNSIIHAGARPVFVDAEEETGNINADLIESAITKKTKAIMPVHLYGQLCDMKKIRKIADKYSLKIIEDSAHCIEAVRDGIRPAQLSDAACFSFYATKNLTCGEGGAIVTNKKEIYDKLKLLRLHGMTKDAEERYWKRYRHWDMEILGWKYNMDNIKAALMINQIERLDTYWKRRKRIYDLYMQGLKGIKNLKFPKVICKSALHIFSIWVHPKKRDQILEELQKKGIGVAVNYRSVHNLSFFKNNFGFKDADFPVADYIGKSTISLPFYPFLKNEEIGYVIKTLRNLLK